MKRFLKILFLGILLSNLMLNASSMPDNLQGFKLAKKCEVGSIKKSSIPIIFIDNCSIVNSEEDNEFEKMATNSFQSFNSIVSEPCIIFTLSVHKAHYISIIIFETDNSPPIMC